MILLLYVIWGSASFPFFFSLLSLPFRSSSSSNLLIFLGADGIADLKATHSFFTLFFILHLLHPLRTNWLQLQKCWQSDWTIYLSGTSTHFNIQFSLYNYHQTYFTLFYINKSYYLIICYIHYHGPISHEPND